MAKSVRAVPDEGLEEQRDFKRPRRSTRIGVLNMDSEFHYYHSDSTDSNERQDSSQKVEELDGDLNCGEGSRKRRLIRRTVKRKRREQEGEKKNELRKPRKRMRVLAAEQDGGHDLPKKGKELEASSPFPSLHRQVHINGNVESPSSTSSSTSSEGRPYLCEKVFLLALG